MKLFLLRNSIWLRRRAILLPIGIMLILAVFLPHIRAQDMSENTTDHANSTDKLAYVSDDNHLMLYDPRDRTQTTLLDNVQSFVLGRDGRVAFTKQDEQDTDLYVFDPSTPTVDPINISHNPAMHYYPLAWSPDGHYMTFVSFEKSSDYVWTYLAISGDQSLYVWDGKNKTNIMPDNELGTAKSFDVDWSYDGRLAFTIRFGWSNLDTPSEIYLWDGNRTINLSQNLEKPDWGATWNQNGQLMFGSLRDDEWRAYVWDGVSFRNGLPDTDAFIPVAPDLKLGNALWTNDGLVALTINAHVSPSGRKEIMLWDTEHKAIVKQFLVSSENAVSWLTEDGQVILSSQLASGHPSYYLDVENTEGQILYSTITGELSWTSDGYLAYCRLEQGGGWILSLWEEEETWDVAKVSYKPAQWQHGSDTFSCNNG